MATSDANVAHRSAIQVCFPSGLHILGMIDLATVAQIIHLVGGRSIRIAEY